MEQLPIISLAGLRSADPERRRATAQALGRACRETGFFYVKDHGVAEAIRDRAFACARELFALPAPQKEQLSIRRSPHNRGYIAMADERLNPARVRI